MAIALVISINVAVVDTTPSAASTFGCSKEVEIAGQCSAQTNGDHLQVVGTIPSNPGTALRPGNSPDTNTGNWTPPKEFSFDDCLANWNSYIRCFRATDEVEDADPSTPEEPALPALTITDLAAFAPAPVTAAGEPDNVGIAGMPTNFVAAASVHTRTGTLFALPLSVRFTPVGYDFDYGDGDRATTASGGQTWDSLGQAPFTPTATSHVYQERGTYLADVDVRYSAEVDLGIGWFPVSGELTTDGPDQEIRIFEAHTALVAFTCTQKPTGPGC